MADGAGGGDANASCAIACATTQGEPLDAALLAFCRSLPKAELHAHLNGCVRDSTLRFVWARRARETRRRQAAASRADALPPDTNRHALHTTHINRELLQAPGVATSLSDADVQRLLSPAASSEPL